MKQIYPDLWQSSDEHPIAGSPDVTSNAYLLIRDDGNILFYNTGREAIGPVSDSADLEHMRELGGVDWQLLCHWHEASPSIARIKEMFEARLGCHFLEESAIQQAAGTEIDLTFQAREIQFGGIDVLPTPGHTPGSACYLYNSPHGKTYLFSGDTLFLENGSLEDGYLPGESNREDLRQSIELLRELDPDVVFSAAAIGGPTFREFTRNEWRAEIDRILGDFSSEADRRAS